MEVVAAEFVELEFNEDEVGSKESVYSETSQQKHLLLGTISFTICFAAWGLISAFAPRVAPRRSQPSGTPRQKATHGESERCGFWSKSASAKKTDLRAAANEKRERLPYCSVRLTVRRGVGA
jgi:hypothetical protein